MAGLDPAIHADTPVRAGRRRSGQAIAGGSGRSWIPGTRPGMTARDTPGDDGPGAQAGMTANARVGGSAYFFSRLAYLARNFATFGPTTAAQ